MPAQGWGAIAPQEHRMGDTDFHDGMGFEGDLESVQKGVGVGAVGAQAGDKKCVFVGTQVFEYPGEVEGSRACELEHVDRTGVVGYQEAALREDPPEDLVATDLKLKIFVDAF